IVLAGIILGVLVGTSVAYAQTHCYQKQFQTFCCTASSGGTVSCCGNDYPSWRVIAAPIYICITAVGSGKTSCNNTGGPAAQCTIVYYHCYDPQGPLCELISED